MDTSKKYIKMCKMAVEIQRLRFDKVYSIRNTSLDILAEKGISGWAIRTEGETYRTFPPEMQHPFMISDRVFIWLPKQDQLQEILDELCAGNIITELFHFYMDSGIPQDYSMEQILLLYVMKKKYNKIWDEKKEDWIKIKEIQIK